jgi:hypothetical protein
VNRVDWKSLSTDELWTLREDVTLLLAKKLEEPSESLARRVAQLEQQRPATRPPFPNEVREAPTGGRKWSRIFAL